MTKVIIAVLAGFALIIYAAGCAGRTDVATGPGPASGRLAAKTAECLALRSGIESDLRKNWSGSDRTSRTYSWLKEIFYSPKLDSCVYARVLTVVRKKAAGAEEPSGGSYQIVDARTFEVLDDFKYEWGAPEDSDLQAARAQVLFDSRVGELKKE